MIIPNIKTYLNPDSIFTNFNSTLNFTVENFWQWAFSDLQQNNIRGILAEFIIAKALNIDLGLRHTWDDFDLITSNGIKIEVKSGAYLQNWKQKKLSEPVFGSLCGQVWNDAEGKRGGNPIYRADIYIFALQTSTTHDEYNALDLSQWEFYIVKKSQLEIINTKSVSLKTVRRLVEPVKYMGIASKLFLLIG